MSCRLTVLNIFGKFTRKRLKWSPLLVKFQPQVNVVNASKSIPDDAGARQDLGLRALWGAWTQEPIERT